TSTTATRAPNRRSSWIAGAWTSPRGSRSTVRPSVPRRGPSAPTPRWHSPSSAPAPTAAGAGRSPAPSPPPSPPRPPPPPAPGPAPDLGVGPSIALAADNTLGSFSPYQGRVYLAYVSAIRNAAGTITDTNISLVVSDDGGLTWGSPINPQGPVDPRFSRSINGG